MERISCMNDITLNHPLEDNYSPVAPYDFRQQEGGNNNDIPTGGFPPIYICKRKPQEVVLSEDEKIKREFKTHKTTVSIKSIMEKRRKTTPFV